MFFSASFTYTWIERVIKSELFIEHRRASASTSLTLSRNIFMYAVAYCHRYSRDNSQLVATHAHFERVSPLDFA